MHIVRSLWTTSTPSWSAGAAMIPFGGAWPSTRRWRGRGRRTRRRLPSASGGHRHCQPPDPRPPSRDPRPPPPPPPLEGTEDNEPGSSMTSPPASAGRVGKRRPQSYVTTTQTPTTTLRMTLTVGVTLNPTTPLMQAIPPSPAPPPSRGACAIGVVGRWLRTHEESRGVMT